MGFEGQLRLTIMPSVHLSIQISPSLLITATFNTAFRANMNEDLMKIARTTLGSKILNQHKDHFAKLAVEAVLRLKVSVLFFNVRNTAGR